MISLTVDLFTQVSDSGPHGPLVTISIAFCILHVISIRIQSSR